MEPKKQAKQLKTFAKEFGYELKLTHAQEIVAKMHGFSNRHAMLVQENKKKVKQDVFYYEVHVFEGRNNSYSNFFKANEKFDYEGDILSYALENKIIDSDDYKYVDYCQEIDKEEYETATGINSMEEKTCELTFVSEWEWTLDDTGIIETKAILNLKDGSLSIEESDMGCDGFIEEYVTLNKRKIPVEEFQHKYKVSSKTLKEIKTFLNKK